MSLETSTSSPGEMLNHASEPVQASSTTRVILVGIGGATCSGKTTLAKHLRNILPDSFIIHQDVPYRFYPPTLPIHPTFGQDWDSAPTAITWPRLRASLRTAKRIARLPDDHSSHDHLNPQKPVQLGESPAARCQEEVARVQKEVEAASGVRIVWGVVDGFLLYWDPEVVDTLDARIFLRVPFDELKERRSVRSGYATAEGTFWKDPPGYFENLVYPAYTDAHRSMFTDGDVEHGSPLLRDLVVIEALQLSMDDMVARCCEELVKVLRRSVDTSAGKA